MNKNTGSRAGCGANISLNGDKATAYWNTDLTHANIEISSHPISAADLSFAGILRERANLDPDGIAYGYIGNEGEETLITYRELRNRVATLARRLQSLEAKDERVLLLYPPGLEFIPAFYAVLAAGAIAVPSPLPRRRERRDRLSAIIRDSGARYVLTVADENEFIREKLSTADEAKPSPLVISTDLERDSALEVGTWHEPTLPPNRIVLIQYTSGATSDPKGVVITEANLIRNCAMSVAAFNLTEHDRGVTWLPVYHDMGLIGGVLTPLYRGFSCRLMNPAGFFRNPLSWLETIASSRITIAGGPDFAYQHCLDRIGPDQIASLNLGSWRVALTGAEPVRASTLRRFATAFARAGFRLDCFRPCYGLAEATLIVTGGPGAPLLRSFESESLSRGEIRESTSHVGTRELVGCGEILPGEKIHIVDPETGLEATPGAIGEIWVDSPCKGRGYWQDPARSKEVFEATLPGRKESYLRTGDLGFLHEGQLFVAGRLRDLIIIRGVNFYPQDIENTCENASNSVRHSGVAAFSVESDGQEHLVIVAELARDRRNAGERPDDLAEALRHAVTAAHEIPPFCILLVSEGSIPRTTSGKIRRSACRDLFENDRLKPIARLDAGSSEDEILQMILAHVQHTETSDPTTSFADLGLDSLQRVALAHRLEHTLNARFPEGVLAEVTTVRDLVTAAKIHLFTEQRDTIPASGTAPVIDESSYRIALFPEVRHLAKSRRYLAATGLRDPFFSNHEGVAAGTTIIDGRKLINFASYNYLGLSGHPEVSAAAQDAITRYGTSVSASRLVSGNRPIHDELEHALADFLGTGAALVFVGGHATNETTIGHLVSAGDLVLHDRLAHNSIIEGAELSGARRWPFEHNDVAALERILDEVRAQYRRVLIVVEGVYSMDGDTPDLRALCELKERHHCLLMVDEAHSFGTMGKSGRGITEHCGVAAGRIDILMGTLSKSLASCGGFIAGSNVLIDYLRYTAPGFVYSVGIPPSATAAALAALRVMQREPDRLERLHARSSRFLEGMNRAGFHTGSSRGTPVVPLITGDSEAALALSARLFAAGINVPPVLAPAVPEASARLRFFLSSEHTDNQIRDTLELLSREAASLSPDTVRTAD